MNWVFLPFLQPTDCPNFLASLGETTVNIRDVLVVAAGLHLVLMFGTPIASGSYHQWSESSTTSCQLRLLCCKPRRC